MRSEQHHLGKRENSETGRQGHLLQKAVFSVGFLWGWKSVSTQSQSWKLTDWIGNGQRLKQQIKEDRQSWAREEWASKMNLGLILGLWARMKKNDRSSWFDLGNRCHFLLNCQSFLVSFLKLLIWWALPVNQKATSSNISPREVNTCFSLAVSGEFGAVSTTKTLMKTSTMPRIALTSHIELFNFGSNL